MWHWEKSYTIRRLKPQFLATSIASDTFGDIINEITLHFSSFKQHFNETEILALSNT